MLKYLTCAASILCILACATVEMWIPMQPSARSPVNLDHVQYLEGPPDKAHEVIGIITPPSGEYETEAQAVKAMRREAARHGADAIYVESKSESGGWRFDAGFGGASGGSFSDVQFRAKAIVWK